MYAFVKSFSTYRTIKQAPVLSSGLVVDSLSDDTSTVTVKGTDIGRSNTGDWLILDGRVYQIAGVKPQEDRTLLTLVLPLDAFTRPLELASFPAEKTIGGFIKSAMESAWVREPDVTYAMPYLEVSNSDNTTFVAPEADRDGLFVLADYCRLMRKSYRVSVQFRDAGSGLSCTIRKIPKAEKQVSFSDGRSQLESVNYSKSGIAKLTVIKETDTGNKDDQGNAIVTLSRSIWYLSETGEISQSIPARRASGDWSTIRVSGNADVEAKVLETFAKNKANHKLEFWSALDLDVQDDCTFFVYGELLQSNISYKLKSSADKRFYYKSGELATTATEKLKGATK